mgnify:CR=1 FL=1
MVDLLADLGQVLAQGRAFAAVVILPAAIAFIGLPMHVEIAVSLVKGLEQHGFDARSAYDGARGRELVMQWEPDLVVVDLNYGCAFTLVTRTGIPAC